MNQCCNCDSNGMIKHHIVPASLGGTDRPSNIVYVCEACHSLIHPGLKTGLAQLRSVARKERAAKGGYAGGGAAIGYKAKRGGKVLQLDQEKALTVKRVFELREERPSWTLQQLADRLNKEGHTTAQGKSFKPMQVKRILDRQGLYSGIYSYSGIEAEGQHDAII
jgi:hypothetical protein